MKSHAQAVAILQGSPRQTRKARALRKTGVGPRHKLVPGDTFENGVQVALRLDSEANASQREHWRVKHGRAKQQRLAVRGMLGCARRPSLPCVVLITRIAPRVLDTDNLAISCKHVRDEVAAWLGCGDGPSDPIAWRYDQQRGAPRAYGVLIRWGEPL